MQSLSLIWKSDCCRCSKPKQAAAFSLEERVELVKQSCTQWQNIEVIGFSGLLADFAKQQNAKALIRGIRGADDIDYEIQLAQLNYKLSGDLETIFFPFNRMALPFFNDGKGNLSPQW